MTGTVVRIEMLLKTALLGTLRILRKDVSMLSGEEMTGLMIICCDNTSPLR